MGDGSDAVVEEFDPIDHEPHVIDEPHDDGVLPDEVKPHVQPGETTCLEAFGADFCLEEGIPLDATIEFSDDSGETQPAPIDDTPNFIPDPIPEPLPAPGPVGDLTCEELFGR